MHTQLILRHPLREMDSVFDKTAESKAKKIEVKGE
jgi:hypothetical protein